MKIQIKTNRMISDASCQKQGDQQTILVNRHLFSYLKNEKNGQLMMKEMFNNMKDYIEAGKTDF